MTPASLPARRLHRRVLAWFARAQRDLPWRRTRDPYAIWVSEVMLQQTRVETVVPYYERFLAAYPTVHALAEAPLEGVLGRWSGLGYYRRARLLHSAAQVVDRELGGALPAGAEGLRALPGVGRYTAGAIASIAWGERVPVVDGNVERVLRRLFALRGDRARGSADPRLWEIAASLVPASDPSSWNQGLMELGATVCLPERPRCGACPVRAECVGRARGLLSELPGRRARKAPANLPRVGFVLRSGGAVLLARRVEDGLFGGMWEPPHVADEGGRARAALLRLAGARVRRVGDVVHVLSHARIEMAVWAGRGTRALEARLRDSPEYAELAWVTDPRSGSHALTRLAQKVLALAEGQGGVHPGGECRPQTRPRGRPALGDL